MNELTVEEFGEQIRHSHMDFDQLVNWIFDLKNTIQDRDKTIAELQDSTHYAIGRAVHRLQQQNTILREALEYEIKRCDACRGTGILKHMRGYDFPCTECANARETLAKVRGDE